MMPSCSSSMSDLVPCRIQMNQAVGNEQEQRVPIVSFENGCLNVRVPWMYRHLDEKSGVRQTRTIMASVGDKEKSSKSKMTKIDSGRRPTTGVSKAHIAPEVPQPPRTQVKTSMKYDRDIGKRLDYKVVDYGQELMEKTARLALSPGSGSGKSFDSSSGTSKLVRSHSARVPSNRASSSSTTATILSNASSKRSSTDRDLSKPKFNSSRATNRALHSALDQLRHLPAEVEEFVRCDKKQQEIVTERANKTLNVPQSGRIYKNLVPIHANASQMSKLEGKLTEDAKTLQQSSRLKDPEPQIEDYVEVQYSRVRPKRPNFEPSIMKPLRQNLNHEFHLLESERQFIMEGDRLVSNC